MARSLSHSIRKAAPTSFNLCYAAYLVLSGWRSSRFYGDWFRSFAKSRSSLIDELPWMPFVATEWLKSHLKPSMRVFEYGSGGSTIFMARRVAHLWSVEHDVKWFELVRSKLEAVGIRNCTYALREPVLVAGDSNTGHAMFDETSYPGLSFESYIRAIDILPDQSLDLIVIDGYARLGCLRSALSKIRRGGYLMLDNSNSPEYEPILKSLQNHPRTNLYGIAPWWPPKRWQSAVWRC